MSFSLIDLLESYFLIHFVTFLNYQNKFYFPAESKKIKPLDAKKKKDKAENNVCLFSYFPNISLFFIFFCILKITRKEIISHAYK